MYKNRVCLHYRHSFTKQNPACDIIHKNAKQDKECSNCPDHFDFFMAFMASLNFTLYSALAPHIMHSPLSAGLNLPELNAFENALGSGLCLVIVCFRQLLQNFTPSLNCFAICIMFIYITFSLFSKLDSGS